jgi:hypothetical protein
MKGDWTPHTQGRHDRGRRCRGRPRWHDVGHPALAAVFRVTDRSATPTTPGVTGACRSVGRQYVDFEYYMLDADIVMRFTCR